jgi:hypothetical protein
MTFAMILDVLVVLLLVPTIIFAVILNGRLSALRKNREELGRLIAAFNDATIRAESGIPRLKRTSEESSKALQEKVEKAQMLRDDLAFMVERADQMAVRLEGAVREAQTVPRSDPRAEERAAPRAPTMAPLASGLDIESAAEAAERAAMELARAAQEAEMGLSEWAPGERRPEDRTRAEKLHAARQEQSAPARTAPARSAAPRAGTDVAVAKGRNLGDAGPFDTSVGSAEHALAERILKEQAAAFDSERRADPPALRAPRPADRPLSRPADRPPERSAERALEQRAPDRDLDRSAEAARYNDSPSAAGQSARPALAKPAPGPARGARSGKLLGAALADEPARTVARPPAQPRKGPQGPRDDDERSEAERELLRALRSVR